MRCTLICILVSCAFAASCGGGEKVPEAPEPEPTIVEMPDRCDPLPDPGTPCEPGDGYCVITWGEPCGYSSALWCTDGVWLIEEEVNLCDEDM